MKSFKNDYLLYILLLICSLLFGLITFHPSVQEFFIQSKGSSERQVIAIAEGILHPRINNKIYRVVKVRTEDGLFVEIYENEPNGRVQLLDRAPLFDRTSGHFTLAGEATNLALTDLDQDGFLEIIAPTFDRNMNARLHIFKFNSLDQRLHRISADFAAD